MTDATQHPNFEKAMASIREDWPKTFHRLENYWRGIYNARPQYLDLENECPRCGAKPFRPCSTPTGYNARTHKVRL